MKRSLQHPINPSWESLTEGAAESQQWQSCATLVALGPAQGISIPLCTCQAAILEYIMALLAFLGHLPSSALRSLSRGRYLNASCSYKHFRATCWEASGLYPTAPWTFCMYELFMSDGGYYYSDEAVWDFSSCFKGCWVLHWKKSTLSV